MTDFWYARTGQDLGWGNSEIQLFWRWLKHCDKLTLSFCSCKLCPHDLWWSKWMDTLSCCNDKTFAVHQHSRGVKDELVYHRTHPQDPDEKSETPDTRTEGQQHFEQAEVCRTEIQKSMQEKNTILKERIDEKHGWNYSRNTGSGKYQPSWCSLVHW